MPYDFSIDKKTGFILIAGYGLVGLLLFLAGFLLGIGYRTSPQKVDIVAQAPAAKVQQTAPDNPAPQPAGQTTNVAQGPGETAPPVLTPVQAPVPEDKQPPDEAAANAPPETTPPAPPSRASNAPQTTPQPQATPPAARPVTATPPTPAEAAASPAETAASPAPAQPAGEGDYAIQVGSFLDAGNAQRMVKNLQGKGYKATVFDSTDAKYRVWHAVRIGPYKDIETASREARSFKDAEHLLALMRPAKTL